MKQVLINTQFRDNRGEVHRKMSFPRITREVSIKAKIRIVPDIDSGLWCVLKYIC